jgi:hypothetical protein
MLSKMAFLSLFLFSNLFQHEVPDERKPYVIQFTNDARGGLFATFRVVLWCLDYYETHPDECVGVTLSFTEPPYIDPKAGPNWWEYYFEPLAAKPPCARTIFLRRGDLGALGRRNNNKMPLSRCHELLEKYIRLRAPLQEEIDHFAAANFAGTHMIGIHYRGTDKKKEAARVSYEAFICAIHDITKDRPEDQYKLFVATDEQAFLDAAKKEFGDRVIHIECERSLDPDKALHYCTSDPYSQGKSAVMDCYLLSRCEELIYTESLLDHVVKMINPHITMWRVSEEKAESRSTGLY